MLILVVLSIFNWFFETLKWQTLVSHLTEITFKEANAQTLGALTASLLTPNRIGDYGAKAMYYQAHLRKKIVLLNLIGNSAQMAITTVFGTSGFIYFVLRFQPELNYNGIFFGIGMITITAVLLVGILKMELVKKQTKTLYKLIQFIKHLSNIFSLYFIFISILCFVSLVRN